ncbi:unnamed protein product [Dictyota dichotoma]
MEKSKLFFNNTINKKELKKIIVWAFQEHGSRKAAYFIDQLKGLGFKYATNSGISISLEDLRVPPVKRSLMQEAKRKIFLTEADASNGLINEVERFQKIIYIWNLTSEALKEQLISFFKKQDPLNSVYIMAFSGARGNIDQVRQLVGMRGLMSDPNGKIIDQAISTNFREGLSITDYIISSYGARKGIVDTAVKTADSGYLTRRLVEITQSIIISELDCKTKRCISISLRKLQVSDNETFLDETLFGRVLGITLFYPNTSQVLAFEGQILTYDLIKRIISLRINLIKIRSPLTCECRRSVCQKCYGLNMASGSLVDLGETVGLVAAQSIGEPGTQLTMRTFHTGGVFSSGLTRQSRSSCTGYVRFIPSGSLKPYRTKYGQNAFLSHRDSSLRILNYFNQITELKIEARTIILVKNFTCIKINDVIFEAAPISKDKTISQKEIKYIIAEKSGELVLDNNCYLDTETNSNIKTRTNQNYIFWILSGQVFTIPRGSLVKVRKYQKFFKNQALSETKVSTTISGFVHLIKTNNYEEITAIKIQNFFQSLNPYKFFIEKNLSQVEKCKIYLSLEESITLKPILNKKNNHFIVGFLNKKKYQTKTGGKFYSFHLQSEHAEESWINRKQLRGYTIFYVPESTVQTVCKKKDFKVKTDSYILKDTEIFPYYKINFSGFISFESDKTIKTVKIIPGKRYFSPNKTLKITLLNNHIYFPGEVVLNTYEIDCLSYLRITKKINGFYFYFIPVTRYEVIKQCKLNKYFQPSLSFKIEDNNICVKSGEVFTTDNSLQLISYPIVLNYILDLINTEILFGIKPPNGKNLPGQIFLGNSQTLVLEKVLPKEIRKKNIIINTLVEDKQFIEAYTTILCLNMIMPWTDYIFSIKMKLKEKKNRLLLTTTSDYKNLFFDDFNHCYITNSFSRIQRTFTNNLILKESGLLKKISGNCFFLHIGQPYLFSKGAIMRKLPGDFIEKYENLGQLIYERLKTGDIIQGLPKIDEILEVRKPKMETLLSTTQGVITRIYRKTHKTFLTVKPNFEMIDYEIFGSSHLLVKKFQYVSIGQPLTEGRINPHNLLQVYFRYFFSLGTLSLYESTYRSILKLQTLILKSVQAIYSSQGVHIADKHIELIIKEITKKVYVEYPGETNFLPGDIIDFDQAHFINKSLNQSKNVFYRPLLLGITKSSLKIDGFLAAASFQETTRVLTQSAIEGKTDWLEGLKENAITGRLIPAGTGFYQFQDIAYECTLLPKLSNNLNLEKYIQSKQTLIKKTIKFKYNKTTK